MVRANIQTPTSGIDPITIFSGAKLINYPITEVALKEAIDGIDQEEGGLVVAAYIGESDSLGGWAIHQIQVTNRSDTNLRLLLWPAPGRVTSLITKRQGQKAYASVQTLYGRLVDIVGKGTPLSLIFNVFEFPDERS